MTEGTTSFDLAIKIISIISAILTPLLVAFFGYFNSQKIEAVKTGYNYLEYKLEKFQSAYDNIDIPLDVELEKSLNTQLQDRHHFTRKNWDAVRHYSSREQSVEEIDQIAERINHIYIEYAKAQQNNEEYEPENVEEFQSLMYKYHERVRDVLLEELQEVIDILEKARG